MFNCKKLVVFNTKITAVGIIYKYFNDFEIGVIKNIQFIKKKNKTEGNIHIRLLYWKNNNISKSFYNNLNDNFKTTKIVYDDPKYFEIEFDKFSHEYFANSKKNENYIYKKFIYFNNDKLSSVIKDTLTNYGTVNNEYINEYNITFKSISKSQQRQIQLLKKQLKDLNNSNKYTR